MTKTPADSLFTEIRQKALGDDVKIDTKQAVNWLARTMRQLYGGLSQKRVIADSAVKTVSDPRVGRFYAFGYDPKHKETLPYYDRFPVVLIIGPAKGGAYGLNFHYLHPRDRAQLFDEIAKIGKRKLTRNTKMQVTYEMLKAASKMKRFKPCLKHYLSSHFTTKLGEIPTDQARIAIHLPTAKFIYNSNRTVWEKSRKQYRS